MEEGDYKKAPKEVFSPEKIDPNSWTISRVPPRLREVNPEAYKPNVVSIGPYGRYEERTRAMEVVKENFFSSFIKETKRDRSEFEEAMKSIAERVNKCYQDYRGTYVQVDKLVRDGFFIVSLIRGKYPKENFYQLGRIQTDIRYDLLLFENQLPFFVLCHLDRIITSEGEDEDACITTSEGEDEDACIIRIIMSEGEDEDACIITSEGEDEDARITTSEGEDDRIITSEGEDEDASIITPEVEDDTFARLALSLFRKEARRPAMWSEKYYPTGRNPNDFKHLLGLVHATCLPSAQGRKRHFDFKRKAEAKEPKSQRSWKFIRSATELEEAGIKFFGEQVQDKKNKSGVESLFDIEFTDDTKVLKIPTFHVDDNTERILRNLMAYEQSIPSSEPTYVSDYVTFMDNLINTGKDVQLLCNCGVVDNWLGDDEAVAQMVNKLRNNIYSSDDFYYAEIFGKVNEHCQRKWNKWKATLKRDYFNSPWSLISFLAAVVLLLFTAIQTLFSVLSYVHQ
ncbi:uncharacterized protein LOC111276962 [Durio zibethinus]|uniref:Uncharacterized protein LOC111276962 n=1 Tax=Durio zibethinus TaxID=66656 RepID=A0A6P5WSP7_DURZI|nr:uncharacterized protein LOC111276962 [Durio zibethinus]